MINIIGSSGFLGSNLSKYFIKKKKITRTVLYISDSSDDEYIEQKLIKNNDNDTLIKDKKNATLNQQPAYAN